ncbi:hypothetical protein [Draconibacterium orientale]|uniref:hypothetical protein n=1 Tax=Draconibacterium orientale TaxID=1168034 RepID=UPI0029C0D575|nr:hypothetical protein [Draconibacterium orientale]
MKRFNEVSMVCILLVFASVVNGFVVMKLWGWFIVPAFEIRPLHMVEAIGIMLFVRFAENRLAVRKKENEDRSFLVILQENIFLVIFFGAFTLLIGWIISLFL